MSLFRVVLKGAAPVAESRGERSPVARGDDSARPGRQVLSMNGLASAAEVFGGEWRQRGGDRPGKPAGPVMMESCGS